MTDEAPPRLSAKPPDGGAVIEGRVSLAIGGQPLAIDVEAPAGPTTLESVLPVFHGLANLLVGRAEARVAAAGRSVSCRKGCGACCRQAVAVAEPEARALAALVEAMPEPRRSRVRERFVAAERRLDASGLAARMAALDSADDAELARAGLDYFRLGMACPFLEDEACSIHLQRPASCREYLVTSPPQACVAPSPEHVEKVELEGKVSSSLYGLAKAATPGGWVLLVQALCFARAHPDPAPLRPGPSWIEAGFRRLAGGPAS